MKGRVLLSAPVRKGEEKRHWSVLLIADHGLEGDAHAGSWLPVFPLS